MFFLNWGDSWSSLEQKGHVQLRIKNFKIAVPSGPRTDSRRGLPDPRIVGQPARRPTPQESRKTFKLDACDETEKCTQGEFRRTFRMFGKGRLFSLRGKGATEPQQEGEAERSNGNWIHPRAVIKRSTSSPWGDMRGEEKKKGSHINRHTCAARQARRVRLTR